MAGTGLYERVERRAFELWEQDGRPEGRALDYWLRAEAEIVGTHSGASGDGNRGGGYRQVWCMRLRRLGPRPR